MRNRMRLSSGNALIANRHVVLDLRRVLHRVDDARKLGKQAVAHELDDAPLVRVDARVDDLISVGLQARERSLLIGTHEAAVANNVSDQNGGEATLHGVLPEKGE